MCIRDSGTAACIMESPKSLENWLMAWAAAAPWSLAAMVTEVKEQDSKADPCTGVGNRKG
eukprot:2593553-Pyramimonas_sp.AAC.1